MVNDKDKNTKRTFVLYDKTKSGFKEAGRFHGKMPGQAAKKAATKGIKDIWIRETNTKKMKHYKGSVVKTLLQDPKMASFQKDQAIRNRSFMTDKAGNVMTKFDDGYDSNSDPVLKGRRPCLFVNVGKTKYLGFEEADFNTLS